MHAYCIKGGTKWILIYKSAIRKEGLRRWWAQHHLHYRALSWHRRVPHHGLHSCDERLHTHRLWRHLVCLRMRSCLLRLLGLNLQLIRLQPPGHPARQGCNFNPVNSGCEVDLERIRKDLSFLTVRYRSAQKGFLCQVFTLFGSDACHPHYIIYMVVEDQVLINTHRCIFGCLSCPIATSCWRQC